MSQKIPTLEDLCMAHRLLYYGRSQSVISDYQYDILEREALKSARKDSPLHQPGGAFFNSNKGFTENQVMLADELQSGNFDFQKQILKSCGVNI